jgi:hypothetical protein
MNKRDWKYLYKDIGFDMSYWLIMLILFCVGYVFGLNDGRNSFFITTILLYLFVGPAVDADRKKRQAKEKRESIKKARIEGEDIALFGMSLEDIYQIKYEGGWSSPKVTKEFKEKEKAMRKEVEKAREKIIGRDWINRLYH